MQFFHLLYFTLHVTHSITRMLSYSGQRRILSMARKVARLDLTAILGIHSILAPLSYQSCHCISRRAFEKPVRQVKPFQGSMYSSLSLPYIACKGRTSSRPRRSRSAIVYGQQRNSGRLDIKIAGDQQSGEGRVSSE